MDPAEGTTTGPVQSPVVLIPYPHEPVVPVRAPVRLPEWRRPDVMVGGAALFFGLGTAVGLLLAGGGTSPAGPNGGDAAGGARLEAGVLGAVPTGLSTAVAPDDAVAASPAPPRTEVAALPPFVATLDRTPAFPWSRSVVASVGSKGAKVKLPPELASRPVAIAPPAERRSPPPPVRNQIPERAAPVSRPRPSPPPSAIAVVPERSIAAPLVDTMITVPRRAEPDVGIRSAPIDRAAIRLELLDGMHRLVQVINNEKRGNAMFGYLIDPMTRTELSRFVEEERPVATMGTVYEMTIDTASAAADATIAFDWRGSFGVRNKETVRFRAEVRREDGGGAWRFAGVRLVSGVP